MAGKKSKKTDEPIPVEPEQIKQKPQPKNKFKIGDIVYIDKSATADLNGFTLFPQYKNDTYTVEAYDEKSGVYTLRRLKLLVRLKEDLILAPDEKAHDPINRKQF